MNQYRRLTIEGMESRCQRHLQKKNQPTTNLDQAKRQVNSVGQAGGRKGGNLKVLQPSNSIDIIM
jgi:hypothetical protein